MKGIMSAKLARKLAEKAWVERASRERGDVEPSDFQERTARAQFRKWWDKEVSNE